MRPRGLQPLWANRPDLTVVGCDCHFRRSANAAKAPLQYSRTCLVAIVGMLASRSRLDLENVGESEPMKRVRAKTCTSSSVLIISGLTLVLACLGCGGGTTTVPRAPTTSASLGGLTPVEPSSGLANVSRPHHRHHPKRTASPTPVALSQRPPMWRVLGPSTMSSAIWAASP